MAPLDTLPVRLPARRDPETTVEHVHRALERLGLSVPVRLWDGRQLGPDQATYRLALCHPWSLRALLVPLSDRTAGEAYARGDIDVEGSMVDALHDIARLRRAGGVDLAARLALARDVLALEPPPRDGGRTARTRLSGRLHTKRRDAEAVRAHYDVGNDFYRTFLDRHLVYSCAYFRDEDPADPAADPEALDRAQVRKLDLICRKLRLRPGERLLDIGCGWGALVLHAAEHHGARAVGITLSQAQAEVARERVAAAGLADRVEIRVEDYRDTAGAFDAVASVGMFEHVGRKRFARYFARAAELTAPGGRFLHHAITTGGRLGVIEQSDDSFVGAHVFPDGALAPAHVAVRHLQEAGFELVDVQQLRPHYARTLRHWLHNLEADAPAARRAAGEFTYRTWRAYMAGSVVGFETGDLGVVQVLGSKGARLPLGRRWMEPVQPDR